VNSWRVEKKSLFLLKMKINGSSGRNSAFERNEPTALRECRIRSGKQSKPGEVKANP
jgi:hypothetical protein